MYDSDCVVVMGSNMAENHPVAFRWPMKAKVEHGAKIIHVDPRFTRTSAVADIYAPVRAGSDIAFLGGVINYVINSERWNKDPFFQTFVVNYTNAATLIRDDFKDTEDLDGVFSGLNGEGRRRVPSMAPYGGRSGMAVQRVHQPIRPRELGSTPGRSRPRSVQSPWNSSRERASTPLVASLVWPPPLKDETLQNPRCVFQIVKRHFAATRRRWSRRPPAAPKKLFSRSPRPFWPIQARSGRLPSPTRSPGRSTPTASRSSAPARCCNFCSATSAGPGAGVMALRGHASIQGSTDIPTLYHSIHGYMNAPSALKKHDTLQDFIATETIPTGLLGEPAEVHGLLP